MRVVYIPGAYILTRAMVDPILWGQHGIDMANTTLSQIHILVINAQGRPGQFSAVEDMFFLKI
jgi:hypothetical protein